MDIRILVIILLNPQIFCELNKTTNKNDSKLDIEDENYFWLLYIVILLVSIVISLTIIFKKFTFEQYESVKNKSSESEEESNVQNCLYGFSLFGKFLLTIFSVDVLFFCYNLVVQAILLIPGLLYDMTYIGRRNFFIFLYSIFTIFSASILIVPTYEFCSFNFLSSKNPFIHLISFMYILNDEDFDKYKEKKI